MANIVALELYSNSIRGAEILRYDTPQAELGKSGTVQLEQEEVVGESIVYDAIEFRHAIEELWRNSGFTSKHVGIVVSGKKFTSRVHETVNQNNIDTIIKTIPLENPDSLPDVEDPIYDFIVTDEIETNQGSKVKGLVIAIDSAQIESIIGGVVGAKMKVDYVDFAPISVTRYINNVVSETGNYILVNIREESSDIVIVNDYIVKTIRITAKGLDTNKRGGGRHAQEEQVLGFTIPNSSQAEVENLVREVAMTVSTQSSLITDPVDTVYVSGPRSTDHKLIDGLKRDLNLKVISLSKNTYVEPPEPSENEDDETPEFNPIFEEFVSMTGGMRYVS